MSEARIEELVSRWKEARDQGHNTPTDELCSDCPELEEELKRRIAAIASMEKFIGHDPQVTVDPEIPTGPSASETVDQKNSQIERAVAVSTGAVIVERSQVPGYTLLGKLGEGGMGIVYKAQHLKLKRIVALKMIRPQRRVDDEDLKRFQIEAEAVARLQHPNIVQVYEIGEHEGNPYFSLEYVDGGSLNSQLAGTPQVPALAATISVTLARAIHAAHQKGIVHRDLKPHNVLMTKDGVPKITDFGLAKQLDSDSAQTRTGAIMGTPSYMAPEQADGKPATPPTDVYALGAILYEMLTGQVPFRGTSVWETLEQVRTKEPVPPSRLQPKVPGDLEVICLKALHKDSGKRYAAAAELADDLERWLRHEPIRARRASYVERGLKWVRRKPYVAATVLAASLALLSTIIGVGYYFYRQNQDLLAENRRLEEKQKSIQSGFELGGENYREGAALITIAEASGTEEWDEAIRKLTTAKGLTAKEPALRELDEKIDRALRYIKNRKVFSERHNEARYYVRMLSEEDLEARAAAENKTDAATDAALAAATELLTATDDFAAAGKERILSGCYELHLIRAETAAQRPGDRRVQAQQALALLEQAAGLGIKTKAYHLYRGRFLEPLGDAAAIAKEEKLAAATIASTALDHFLVGLEAKRQGAADDLRQAGEAFMRAVNQEPNHFWASYHLAEIHLSTRENAAALANLTNCIRLRPEFVWPYLLRGFTYGEMRNFSAARAELDRAQAMIDKNDDLARYVLHVNRGALHMRQGHDLEDQDREKKVDRIDAGVPDYLAAVKELEIAARILPKAPQSHANLAEVFQMLARAKKHDEPSVRHFRDQALAALSSAIKLAPNVLHYRTRARLLVERKEFDLAFSDLEEALKLSLRKGSVPEHIDDIPNGVVLTTEERKEIAADLIERGNILYRRDEFGGALASYTLAAFVYPVNLMAYRLRGETLFKLQRYVDALDDFDTYLDRGGPPVMELFEARGLARAKLGKFELAAQDYTRALEVERLANRHIDDWKPTARLLVYRGWAYVIANATTLAMHDFDEALKVKPRDSDALLGRGHCRARLGLLTKAVEDTRAALDFGPAEPHEAPRLFYNAARNYAMVANQWLLDPTRKRQSPTKQEDYTMLCVDLLCRSVELTPPDARATFWQSVQVDEVLEGIRSTVRYRNLAKSISGGS